MANLSISAAWDETRAILVREGKLLASVALALVALPAAVSGLVSPNSVGASTPVWSDLLVIVTSLIALAGQLALIRLALAPSITVEHAIVHGLVRLPVYLVAGIVIMAAMLVAAIPFVLVLAGMGIPLDGKLQPSGTVAILLLLYLAIVVFIGVRMIMAGPVASAESVGPLAILKRSWALTAGNFGRLFGFLFAFFVATVVVLLGIGSAVGVLVGVTAGTIEPMSASALVIALVQALLNAIITTVFAVMLARLYVQLSGGGEAQASVPKSGT